MENKEIKQRSIKTSIIVTGYYKGEDLPHIKHGEPYFFRFPKDIIKAHYFNYIVLHKLEVSMKQYIREKIDGILKTGSIY